MERCLTDQVRRIDLPEYAEILPQLKHVFLVGDLQRPLPHPFVRDRRVEVIVCSYEPGDDGRYHWHREVTEYELVVDGRVGYFEVATGKAHWFATGDFIVIPPGVCVRRLVLEAVRTIALKVPSRAEKVHCDRCERVCTRRVKRYRG